MSRRRITDALGRTVEFSDPPRRLVSLVPSHTETLFDLGAGDRVVGVTRYCVHPADATATRPKVGGTKQIDETLLASLEPDLILAEQEENTREMVACLEARFPVHVSRIRTLEGALENIRIFGDIVGFPARGEDIATRTRSGLERVRGLLSGRVAYLIWRRPYMAAGPETFIDALLAHLGLENVITPESGRYPAVTLETLAALDPTHVLLSSEPFPFGPRHVTEIKSHLPGARVHLVDGEMFSWHGSRLQHLPDYMEKILPVLREA